MQRGDSPARSALILLLPLCGLAVPVAGASLPPLASVELSSDYIFVDSFEPVDCSLPLTCPTPLSGKACVAGQLSDADTTQPLHATFNVGLTCGNGAIGGPCDLSVAVHDALEFAANPAGSTPLTSGDSVVDGCGRYRFSNLSVPPTGFAAIVTEDAPGSAGHMPSGTLRALAANQKIDGIDAVVATTTTVMDWSFAGFGDSSYPLLLLRYTTGGLPTPGVTANCPLCTPGATYRYFSDADAQRLNVSTSATSTGANGSALVTNGPLGSYSGSGGETNGCHWVGASALTVSGALFVADVVCSP